MMELIEKFVSELVKRNPSIDEACELLGITEETKNEFLKNCQTLSAGWELVKTGCPCKCGRVAEFAGQRHTFVKDGLGYDGFRFICDCGKKMEKCFRAPNLDGTELEGYVVYYTKEEQCPTTPDMPQKEATEQPQKET